MRRLWVAGFALAACCPTATPPSTVSADPSGSSDSQQRAPTTDAWRQAREELADLRARFAPRRARTLHVKLAMEHGPTGRRLEARGAVAVGRHDALRMILLGPGGTTALDLWVCGDDYRYVVPALDMQRRGRVDDVDEGSGGFPVAFLRWWFLERLEGRLLSFGDDGSTRDFVLRHRGRVLRVRGGGDLSVSRDEETLTAEGGDCGHARYHHAGLGLTVDVVCERVDEGRPPSRAFADPDAPERACEAEGA